MARPHLWGDLEGGTGRLERRQDKVQVREPVDDYRDAQERPQCRPLHCPVASFHFVTTPGRQIVFSATKAMSIIAHMNSTLMAAASPVLPYVMKVL